MIFCAFVSIRTPERARHKNRTSTHGTGAGGTGRGAFDAGRCVEHSDVAHRSVGCIRAQPCTRCDCHWRRSGRMRIARGAGCSCRGQEADRFRSRARPRDFLQLTPLQRLVTLFPEPSVPGQVRS